MEMILSCPDLAETVLRNLDHISIVALGRTNSVARTAVQAAIRDNPSLLAVAARNADRPLTKTALMGWFALTRSEADALPRSVYARRRPGGGCYFLYRAAAFERAVAIVVARDGTESAERQQTKCQLQAKKPTRSFSEPGGNAVGALQKRQRMMGG